MLNALRTATAGPVIEAYVSGVTGMLCNGFKGGIGRASRVVSVAGRLFTVGVLVQCNYNWEGKSLGRGDKWVSKSLPVGQHCYTDDTIATKKP